MSRIGQPLITPGNLVKLDDTQTLTNKTLTSPKINENVAVTSTATELNALDGQTGAWTTWNPTTTNITTTSGTFYCSYIQIGKIVHCRFKFVFGASSAMGTNPTITLPVTAVNLLQTLIVPIGLFDVGAAFYTGYGFNDTNASVLSIYASKSDGTYLNTTTNVTATIPHTWANTDIIIFNCTYEAA